MATSEENILPQHDVEEVEEAQHEDLDNGDKNTSSDSEMPYPGLVSPLNDQEDNAEQELLFDSDNHESVDIAPAEDVGHHQGEQPGDMSEHIADETEEVGEEDGEGSIQVDEHHVDGASDEDANLGDANDEDGANLGLDPSDEIGVGDVAEVGANEDIAALSNAEGAALSNAEGAALSNAEGAALSNAEGEEEEAFSENDPVIVEINKKLNEFACSGNATRLKEQLESMTKSQFEAAYPCWSEDDSSSPLHEAVAACSKDCVRLLVERIKKHEQELDMLKSWCTSRIDLERNSETAIMRAVKFTHPESLGIIQYLIDQGAKTDGHEMHFNRNLLHIACIYENEEAAKILLRAEENDTDDCNLLLDSDLREDTAVGLAIIHNKINMARIMIAAAKSFEELHGIEEYDEDEDDEVEVDADNETAGFGSVVDVAVTTATYAADDNDDLDSEAAATAHDDEGDDDYDESIYRRPYPNLHLACMHGRIEIVNMLFDAETGLPDFNGTSKLVKMIDFENKTPLHWALENRHFKIAERCIEKGADITKLLSKKNKTKTSILHLIADTGDENTVALLHDKGAVINQENVHKETPLYAAAAQNNVGVCKELITRGADPEKKTKIGFTPLLIAANAGHAKTVKTLLDKGANIFAKSKEGRSALHLAAISNNVDTLKVLMEHVKKTNPHALIDLLDDKGNTPLHYVAEYGNLEALQCLREYNVDMITQNLEGMTALHLASKSGMTSVVENLIDKNKILVSFRDAEGNTALHLAAMAGEDQVIRILVKKGKAKLEERNDSGMRALHMAAKENLPTTCELLLDLGAEIDSKDESKATPLQIACGEGSSHVVTLLIEKHADVKHLDFWGESCMDIAFEKNQTEVALALIQSHRWKEALKDTFWDDGEKRWDTPMRTLIRKMPDVAKEVLEKCSERTQKVKKKPKKKQDSTKEKKKKEAKKLQTLKPNQPPEKVRSDEDHISAIRENESKSRLNENQEEFKFNYEFIDDAKWKKEEITKKMENAKYWFSGVPNNGEKESKKSVKENHCLRVMITYKREDLLSLPLVRSLLRKKWREYGLKFFCINLFFYALFLISLTTYMLSTAFMAPFQYKDLPALENYTGTSCETIRQYTAVVGPVAVLSTSAVVSKYFILILSIIQITKELVQLPFSGLSYLTNIENLFEWFIYTTAILLVVDIGEPCHAETGIRLDWQWQVGAVCVFWSWINLLLFIRKLPVFGLYVVIFTTILRSFMLFFPVLMLFIIAFAISFYCLLANQVPFRFEIISMFKVFVMMIGEMDYGNVFDDRVENKDGGVQIRYEVVTYIQFALFLIIMAILIMNLLVGLAVDDIKRLTDESQLQTLAMQAEFLLDVEPLVNFFSRYKERIYRLSARCKQRFTKSENGSYYDDKRKCSSPCLCVRHNQVHDIFHGDEYDDEELEDVRKSCSCNVMCRSRRGCRNDNDQDNQSVNDEILYDGRHRVRLESHRGTMARLARNWVLSETAIIEESYKAEKSDQEKTADEMKKLPDQVEHLTAKNEEMKAEIMKISRILETMAKR